MQTKNLSILVLLLMLGACSTVELREDTDSSWVMIFENDAKGNVIDGDKDALISAIKLGKPVRVYTQGRTIGHAADASFLSIFEGEVFAQLEEIQSQRPGRQPTRIEFRKPGEKWRSIVGTNGFVTAYIDGNDPNLRTGGTRWLSRTRWARVVCRDYPFSLTNLHGE